MLPRFPCTLAFFYVKLYCHPPHLHFSLTMLEVFPTGTFRYCQHLLSIFLRGILSLCQLFSVFINAFFPQHHLLCLYFQDTLLGLRVKFWFLVFKRDTVLFVTFFVLPLKYTVFEMSIWSFLPVWPWRDLILSKIMAYGVQLPTTPSCCLRVMIFDAVQMTTYITELILIRSQHQCQIIRQYGKLMLNSGWIGEIISKIHGELKEAKGKERLEGHVGENKRIWAGEGRYKREVRLGKGVRQRQGNGRKRRKDWELQLRQLHSKRNFKISKFSAA